MTWPSRVCLDTNVYLVGAVDAASPEGRIPREDIEIYLTVRAGKSEVFVSANHELVQALGARTGEFESCTPEAFVERYLTNP